jgi:multiple sugar transport system permease protein
MKRFFDNLPREIFEAARIDGCGPFRLFFNIVIPMSRPILGVVSIFAILASFKDYLWPLLVLGDTNANLQTVAVHLPQIEPFTPLGDFLAALALSALVPIVGFLIFQRGFLRGTGLSGALKG